LVGKRKTRSTIQKNLQNWCFDFDPFFSNVQDSFKEAMRELGYVEGRNVTYDVFSASQPIGNEKAVQKMIEEKVDLLFPIGTEISIETKKVAEGSGVPVVFGLAFIEGTGLVQNVRTPGNNITGVRYPTTESAVGRLELLHEIAPKVKRVWATYLKNYPTVPSQIAELNLAARKMGITLTIMPFENAAEVKEYLDGRMAAKDPGIDAILELVEPFSVTPEVNEVIYKFADKYRLPISSALILKEASGPIVGFHPDNLKFGKLAAPIANKVLKGISAGTIPVVTADNDLRINYKLTKKLGLTVGEGLLSRSIEIVK